MPEDINKFLHKQARLGDFDSQGRFTVDLQKARKRLAADALESSYHFLLKFVQLANALNAVSLEVRTSRTQTELFLKMSDDNVAGLGPTDAFAMLEGERDAAPEARDLMVGLMACLHPEHRECRYEQWDGNQGCRLTISSNASMALSSLRHPLPEQRGLRLAVEHRSRWNPWKLKNRLQTCRDLLQRYCSYSPVPITYNQTPIPEVPTAQLNSHLSDFGGSQFNVAIGAFQDAPRPAAASCVLYALADGPPYLAVGRPSLEEYQVHRGNLNVWARGLSRQNTLRPNGQAVPAWMLQYRLNGKNLPMTDRPQRELCRAVLVMNLHAIGNIEPLRLYVVRHGVLCLEAPPLDEQFEVEAFKGCTLVLADTSLHTDLSGLHIRHDQRLEETLEHALQYLRAGEEYFEQCARVLTFA